MPGTELGDRLDHLLRTVEDGVTAGDPAVVARRGRRRRLARRTAGVGAVAVLLAGGVVVASLLPERPAHTAGWTEEALAAIVTRDSLIGVARL